MSLFLKAKRDAYSSQRGVSNGAGITLVAGAGYYYAHFDCATRVASVLGNRDLRDMGDGVPYYEIMIEDMSSACGKLTNKFSVALVDSYCDDKGNRFCLLWKIQCNAKVTYKAPTSVDDI